MEMDDVPRFKLARDNIPNSNLTQAGGLSKANFLRLAIYT